MKWNGNLFQMFGVARKCFWVWTLNTWIWDFNKMLIVNYNYHDLLFIDGSFFGCCLFRIRDSFFFLSSLHLLRCLRLFPFIIYTYSIWFWFIFFLLVWVRFEFSKCGFWKLKKKKISMMIMIFGVHTWIL